MPENNLAINGGVEDGLLGWSARGPAVIARTTDDMYSGEASLLVTGRQESWHGATFSLGTLTPGNVYEVAAWVKLAPGEPSGVIKLTAKRVDDADDTSYLEYTEVDSAQVTAAAWTLLTGTYIPDGTTPFEHFIFESVDGESNVSFYVDEISVAGEIEEVEMPPIPDGTGLAALVDIPIGVAVAAGSNNSADILSNAPRQTLVRQHFNQITAENIMKMSYMYSGGQFNFTQADRLVDWARRNGLGVHGHALVWHSAYQLPEWATDNNSNFRQDYERHLETVAAHYAGRLDSWDVVNEALYDPADSADGLGSANGYRQSVFYRQYNGPGYIEEAFRLARAADPDAELYYNDFNTEENGAKTDALVSLVESLLAAGAPIDGVGFQMHVLLDYPSIANIRESMQRIVDLSPDLKIKITELDVRINNPYDGNTRNDYTGRGDCAQDCPGLARQKARYKQIIDAFYDVVPAGRRGGITVWGIADPDSWFYTHAGLPDWPLLFNEALQPKPAFEGVQEALQDAAGG